MNSLYGYSKIADKDTEVGNHFGSVARLKHWPRL